MARPRRRGLTPLDLWVDALETAQATAVTLSVRVPQLMKGTMTRAESTRMVAEKAATAAEGFMAGTGRACLIAAKRIARPAPYRALQDAAEVVEAATKPARRRVKANATRLSKR